MKYHFTRAEVVEAIETELVLVTGCFFDMKSYIDGFSLKAHYKECAVCIVGAIVRNKKTIKIKAGFSSKLIGQTYNPEVYNELNKANYLGTLSTFFEKGFRYKSPNTAIARMKLINFVLGTFPTKFSVEVA